MWVDDLLIHSQTFDYHLRHLRQAFTVERKYGLVFNRSKMKLCRRRVKYVGYIFGVGGISTDPEKLSAVQDMPQPKIFKKIRMLLDFAGFYRRFMSPNYASIISPLTDLTKPTRKFVWTKECQRDFDRVKLLLTTTPVLVHPDFKIPFHIHCDASGRGIGAVLSQYVKGAYRPVAFCSKRLLPHQLNWTPAQLEAYAVFYAVCVKWRYYLTLNKTVVHTDHRNLSCLFDHAQKGMIGRWYAQLSAYDLDITYVSGKTQATADPLSRILRATLLRTSDADAASEPFIVATILCRAAAFHVSQACWAIPSWTETAWVEALPSNMKYPDKQSWDGVRKFLTRHFKRTHLARNLPRGMWASHQRNDPVLGPIYAYLSTKATTLVKPGSPKIRAAGQSHQLVQGVLHYQSMREVGTTHIRHGWLQFLILSRLR